MDEYLSLPFECAIAISAFTVVPALMYSHLRVASSISYTLAIFFLALVLMLIYGNLLLIDDVAEVANSSCSQQYGFVLSSEILVAHFFLPCIFAFIGLVNIFRREIKSFRKSGGYSAGDTNK